MKITFVLFITCVAGIACNFPKVKTIQQKEIVASVYYPDSDTINSWQYRYVDNLSDQLNLQPLNRGYNSFQTRIWFLNSIAIKQYVMIMSRSSNGLGGEIIEIKSEHGGSASTKQILTSKKTQIRPKSGWSNFFQKIDSSKILQFRNEMVKSGADGNSICVELATDTSYTWARTWSPHLDPTSSFNNSQMTKLLDLIKREFNFTYLDE